VILRPSVGAFQNISAGSDAAARPGRIPNQTNDLRGIQAELAISLEVFTISFPPSPARGRPHRDCHSASATVSADCGSSRPRSAGLGADRSCSVRSFSCVADFRLSLWAADRDRAFDAVRRRGGAAFRVGPVDGAEARNAPPRFAQSSSSANELRIRIRRMVEDRTRECWPRWLSHDLRTPIKRIAPARRRNQKLSH